MRESTFNPRHSGSSLKAIVALVLAALPFSACSAPVFGNGRVETERRSVPAFSSISLSGSGELRVHRGAQKLEVTVDSNLLPYIETKVVDGRLRVGFKPGANVFKMSKLVVEATMPELDGLAISGSGDAVIDRFEGRSFESVVSGSGSVRAQLDYESVSFTISGSGSYALEGSADEALFRISGSGDLRAKDFAADRASVGISGSGDAELRVEDLLEVSVAGSGSVRYRGSPRLDQKIAGSGSIRKVGD